jgi:hypothetical protein
MAVGEVYARLRDYLRANLVGDCVHELAHHGHGDHVVRLDDATNLRISRGYRARLETRLGRQP